MFILTVNLNRGLALNIFRHLLWWIVQYYFPNRCFLWSDGHWICCRLTALVSLGLRKSKIIRMTARHFLLPITVNDWLAYPDCMFSSPPRRLASTGLPKVCPFTRVFWSKWRKNIPAGEFCPTWNATPDSCSGTSNKRLEMHRPAI